MIKFVITPSRFVEACTMVEYIGVVVGNLGSQMSALPKMLVDENGKYIVEVSHNEDGDPIEWKNLKEANELLNGIGIKRFEKLKKELTEAARQIVNPQNGGDSTRPSPQRDQKDRAT